MKATNRSYTLCMHVIMIYGYLLLSLLDDDTDDHLGSNTAAASFDDDYSKNLEAFDKSSEASILSPGILPDYSSIPTMEASIKKKKKMMMNKLPIDPSSSVKDLSPADIEYINQLPNLGRQHCSALLKVLSNFSDVLFAHNTWDNYQAAAPRIFKHYRYPSIKDQRILRSSQQMYDTFFSSSPVLLSSVDDFYINYGGPHGSQMTVMETSLDIYNPSLYDYIHPQSILCWIRVNVANQLSTTGDQWAQLFSRSHSGTYANQWMILDFNAFNKTNGLEDGFFTLLEELPGEVAYGDLTQVLKSKTYWASYNAPYFPEIATQSMNRLKCEVNSENCYQSNSRANIFRTEQQKIESIADLQRLIQLNNYMDNPYSMNDSCFAIACRNDLMIDVSKRSPFGAIDAKVSSIVLARHSLHSAAVDQPIMPIVMTKLGPTSDSLPPFCWHQFDHLTDSNSSNRSNSSNSTAGMIGKGRKYSHSGHPECFHYDWQQMPPPSVKR